jgi:hypothetical protein
MLLHASKRGSARTALRPGAQLPKTSLHKLNAIAYPMTGLRCNQRFLENSNNRKPGYKKL